jgi:hypothetical protein
VQRVVPEFFDKQMRDAGGATHECIKTHYLCINIHKGFVKCAVVEKMRTHGIGETKDKALNAKYAMFKKKGARESCLAIWAWGWRGGEV